MFSFAGNALKVLFHNLCSAVELFIVSLAIRVSDRKLCRFSIIEIRKATDMGFQPAVVC